MYFYIWNVKAMLSVFELREVCIGLVYTGFVYDMKLRLEK